MLRDLEVCEVGYKVKGAVILKLVAGSNKDTMQYVVANAARWVLTWTRKRRFTSGILPAEVFTVYRFC